MINLTKALIVDDEPDICELLQITLSGMDILSDAAHNLEDARKLLASNSYFLCLTDMRLQDGDGIDLVKHIQEKYPQLPVAVITAYGNIEGAVNTLKEGAFDYVSKPVNLSMLRRLVNTALTLAERDKNPVVEPEHLLLGDSQLMCELRDTIKKLSRSQAPVFISGESGTGKELVAQLIHAQGPRANNPFVPVNCGAIPAELMESEFFGHKKGSFTGAVSDKTGLFAAAQDGTLFFDEVADLPLHMQVKLLRAIQEKAIRPVGASEEISIDVRILSATHKSLQQLVEQEEFRQDLFYRINVIEVRVPSLRERKGDIPLLAEHILTKLSSEQEVNPPSLSKECLHALKNYHFPGNVRELENILERSMTLCNDNVITENDLQLQVPTTTSDLSNESSTPFADVMKSPPDLSNTQEISMLDNFLGGQERGVILKALEECKWNRTAAAKKLGITLRALRYRIKKLKLE